MRITAKNIKGGPYMKIKKCFLTILCFMMLCIMAPGHIAQAAAPEVKVQVDEQLVEFPDQKPYIDAANRTMVPVRAPMEKMGCTVDWNANTRQATITKGDKTAVFTIGKNTYTVNGQSKTMDTKAVITNDRTAFPIRFAAEAMGATVDWGADTYTVIITTTTQGKGIEKLTTTGLPGYKDPTLPNYKATIPFTSANGTEITGITYRDGAVRLQMGQKPVEMIRIYTDLGSQGATIKVGDNTTVQKTVGGGYESEFKVSDITKLQRFETLKIFIPGDGLYVVPNPFK